MPAPRKAKSASAEPASAEAAAAAGSDEQPARRATKASAKAPAKKVPAAAKPAAPESVADDKTPVRAKKTDAAKDAPVEHPAPESDQVDATDETVPMNRAMRRAKGKGGQSSATYGPSRVVGSKGPAHTHRMWSNRRSGG